MNKKNIWHNINRVSVEVKASIAYVFCNVVQKGVQFLTVPVFARILSTNEYGQFTLYQSWLSIITVLATFNLSAGVFNNGMVNYPDKRDQYISSIQALSSVISGCFIIIYILNWQKWNQLLGLPEIIIPFMFLEIFFSPSLAFWTARQRYEYKYKSLVIISIGIALIQPIVGFVVVKHSKQAGTARIISLCVVNIVIGLFFYIYNYVKGKELFKKEYWLFALKFSIPLIPHHLSGNILSQSDRIMIAHFCGNSQAAIYGIVYQTGMVMNLITKAIMGSLVPWVYDNLKEKKIINIRNLYQRMWIGVGFLALFPVLFAPEAMYILGGNEYKDGIYMIAPIAVSEFCSFVCCTFSTILYFYEKTAKIMYSTISTSILNIILNIIFIPHMGYSVAAYTTLISYIVYVLLYDHYVRKALLENNICDSFIGIKKIIINTGVLVIISEVIKLFYTLFWVRIALFVLFGWIAFLYFKYNLRVSKKIV